MRRERTLEGHPAWRIVPGTTEWPVVLDQLPQPPSAVWVAGHRLPTWGVAIVGARRATALGLHTAAWLARQLASLGIPVISGMALGIDGAAHRGAIEGGGPTVAVLGCGLDVCYPRQHRDLRRLILEHGSLVTEEEWGTPADPWRFPKRNRIIAALAAAVVVVEAGERSGALSTARHAADLGRDVLAVPGSIHNPVAVGTNRLIRDGAAPLLEVDDLLDVLGGRSPSAGGSPGAACPGVEPRAGRTAVEQRVLRLLEGGPTHPDALAEWSGLGPAEVAATVSRLEIAGLVRRGSGGCLEVVPSPRPGGRERRRPGATPDRCYDRPSSRPDILYREADARGESPCPSA